MPTFKVLSNILDFLEAKNSIEKLPDDEDIEVCRQSMSWKKKLPKVERPEPKEGELRKSLDCDKYTSVEVTIDRYYDGDRQEWKSYIEVTVTTKNSHTDCTIPIRGLTRLHPTVLRAKRVFRKIEKDCIREAMLNVDKHLAMADSHRIDDILWGDTNGEKDTTGSEES